MTNNWELDSQWVWRWKTLIVVITGGRDHIPTNEELNKFNSILEKLAYYNGSLTMKIGDCPTGVDRVIASWMRSNKNRTIDIEGNKIPLFKWEQSLFSKPYKVYKAEWDLYGKSAGPRRNSKMVCGADILIAFPGGKGTENCVKEALNWGVKVIHINDPEVNSSPLIEN